MEAASQRESESEWLDGQSEKGRVIDGRSFIGGDEMISVFEK